MTTSTPTTIEAGDAAKPVMETPPVPEPASPTTSQRIAAEAAGDPQPDGTPALIPPNRLRVRQRSAFLLLATRGRELFAARAAESDAEQGSVAGQPDEEDTANGVSITAELLDYIADIDDALESVAIDQDSYREWATGGDAEQSVTSLFEWYVGRLGESRSSAS